MRQMSAQAKQVPPLHRDTNIAIREIMATIGNLQHIYVEETNALIEINTNRFLELQEDKLDKAIAYQAHISQMIARKDELKNADPVLKQKLKELQINFEEMSKRNIEALGRMERCTQRLANTIRNAAVRAARAQRTFSYGQNGTVTPATHNKVISSGVSETV